MTRWLSRLLAALLGLLTSLGVLADERMVMLDVGRENARLPVYVMTHPQARATLILLPGGDAGTGRVVDDQPGSGNFLVRSRTFFQAAGFHVMVVFRPSDRSSMDYGYRLSAEHIADLARAISYAQQNFAKPVWLVGTSRGTVSGTAAAIALGDQVQGLVLTSSVTSRKQGAVAAQDIGRLRIPVLVVHHRNDACKVCVPHEASRITEGLTAAPVKKFVMVDGGADPEGDPCEARHWHGFINFEKETVELITDWIRQPRA